jgi:hypothetical protein
MTINLRSRESPGRRRNWKRFIFEGADVVLGGVEPSLSSASATFSLARSGLGAVYLVRRLPSFW